jgi:hypothetical protein
VAAARDVRRGPVEAVDADHERCGGIDGGRRFDGYLPADADPAAPDQVGGMVTAARKPTPDELGVESGPPAH